MEPIKVFLDTNIVLDYYTGRQNDGLAETIMKLSGCNDFNLCISILTGVNVLYVLKRYSNIITMDRLYDAFDILPMTVSQWIKSADIDISDPEDAIQVACARESGCKAIVTRDKHLLSLTNPGIECYSPESFIRKLLGD